MEWGLHSLFYGGIVDYITLIIGWIMAVAFFGWFITQVGGEFTTSFWVCCMLALGYGFLKEIINN